MTALVEGETSEFALRCPQLLQRSGLVRLRVLAAVTVCHLLLSAAVLGLSAGQVDFDVAALRWLGPACFLLNGGSGFPIYVIGSGLSLGMIATAIWSEDSRPYLLVAWPLTWWFWGWFFLALSI